MAGQSSAGANEGAPALLTYRKTKTHFVRQKGQGFAAETVFSEKSTSVPESAN